MLGDTPGWELPDNPFPLTFEQEMLGVYRTLAGDFPSPTKAAIAQILTVHYMRLKGGISALETP